MEEPSRHNKWLGGDWRGEPQGVKLILERRMQGSYQVGAGCRHYPDSPAPSESEGLVLEKAPEITAYTHPGECDLKSTGHNKSGHADIEEPTQEAILIGRTVVSLCLRLEPSRQVAPAYIRSCLAHPVCPVSCSHRAPSPSRTSEATTPCRLG